MHDFNDDDNIDESLFYETLVLMDKYQGFLNQGRLNNNTNTNPNSKGVPPSVKLVDIIRVDPKNRFITEGY